MPDEAKQKNADLLRAYKLAFGSPAGQAVLVDLVKFCRGAETCVVAEKGMPVDRERTLILEGRREVWLRLTEYLYLTPDEVLALRMERHIIDKGDQDDG